MITAINSRMVLSAATILAAAALIVGATFAFFTDTETSTGNTFTAGTLDLKVDNTCYYNKIADGTPNCPVDESIVTSWTQTDLGLEHKFFYFTDIKPGDFGEDTVSLHITDNDGWARLVISAPVESENGCSGEEATAEPTCSDGEDGELRENTTFNVWLDQGFTPGYQCNHALAEPTTGPCTADPQEGDNINQDVDGTEPLDPEPTLITDGTIDVAGETWNLWEGLAPVAAAFSCSGDGNTNYALCHGLATDGRMVGSATYYFGIAWEVPDTVGNAMQGDGMVADMTFEAEQHRNNPTPFTP